MEGLFPSPAKAKHMLYNQPSWQHQTTWPSLFLWHTNTNLVTAFPVAGVYCG